MDFRVGVRVHLLCPSFLPFPLCSLRLSSSSFPLLSLHHSALSSLLMFALLFESVPVLSFSHPIPSPLLSFIFLSLLFFFSSSCITFLTSLHLLPLFLSYSCSPSLFSFPFLPRSFLCFLPLNNFAFPFLSWLLFLSPPSAPQANGSQLFLLNSETTHFLSYRPTCVFVCVCLSQSGFRTCK